MKYINLTVTVFLIISLFSCDTDMILEELEITEKFEVKESIAIETPLPEDLRKDDVANYFDIPDEVNIDDFDYSEYAGGYVLPDFFVLPPDFSFTASEKHQIDITSKADFKGEIKKIKADSIYINITDVELFNGPVKIINLKIEILNPNESPLVFEFDNIELKEGNDTDRIKIEMNDEELNILETIMDKNLNVDIDFEFTVNNILFKSKIDLYFVGKAIISPEVM